MAGYSGTPLPKKLGIKEGSLVALVGAPAGFAATLGELPAGAAIVAVARQAETDVVVFFAITCAAFEARFAELATWLRPAGGLWVAWPKRTSGVATDLNENLIREFGLADGLVDNKVCAIDETWSGLRFVYRLRDRPPKRKQ